MEASTPLYCKLFEVRNYLVLVLVFPSAPTPEKSMSYNKHWTSEGMREEGGRCYPLHTAIIVLQRYRQTLSFGYVSKHWDVSYRYIHIFSSLLPWN